MDIFSCHKKLLFISFLCLFLSHLGLGQVSQKAYQTILANNIDLIKIDIDGARVQLKETKGSRILIESMVTLSVPNKALLDFVIGNGRYELIHTTDQSRRELLLEIKKNKNVILVKGKACTEIITYTIYIPTSTKAITK